MKTLQMPFGDFLDSNLVVLNLGSIEPKGFSKSVSGVRQRSRHTPNSYDL